MNSFPLVSFSCSVARAESCYLPSSVLLHLPGRLLTREAQLQTILRRVYVHYVHVSSFCLSFGFLR